MTAAVTTSHRPADGEKRRTPAVITLLVLATFVVILNETIMLNAIPNLMNSFGVTEHAAQWVSTAFMLTMASVIPVTGWFLQRVTTRTAYATAMAVFIAGTLISAIAPVFGVLLAGRVIQAAGTAVMMPLLMTTLMTVVDESDRGRVMGNVTMAISVAPALGPTLSGLILGFGSWRLLFLLVLPIAVGVAWSGLRRLENVNEPAESSVDWASVVIAALGFGSLVYGLSRFAEGEVGLPLVIAGLGALLILGFVLRQLRLQRVGSPLLDLRAFLHPTFTKSLVLMAIAFLAMMGSMILLPLYLQTVRGLSPLYTGLLVMPGGLAMGLLGPTVGRIFDTYGGRVLVIPGSVGIVVALGGLSQISLTTPYALVLVLHLILMVSLAAAFTPVFTLGLGSLPSHLYSHGSSILGTLQQVAAAFGTALAVTVMSVRSDQVIDEVGAVAAHVSGLQAAFLVSAGLALIVVVMAVLLPARAEGHEEAAAEPAAEPEADPSTSSGHRLEADLDAELAELCEHGREPAVCGC
ncbi:MDR family MFS transporter [Nocardioides sp. NPDC047086]|uniref:MDR family MFS transporter n=1 Tax=Nocardioides sp. NPDC047086 TaxID=3154810 RepID=UPI0034032664